MKRKLFSSLLTAILLVGVLVRAAGAASFDCTKAASAVEKLICNVKKLSELDDQLSIQYKTALSSASDKEAVKAEQRRWLKEQRNACKDAACLADAYEQRLAALSDKQVQSVPASDWAGEWENESGDYCFPSFLRITPISATSLEYAVSGTGASERVDFRSGKAEIRGNQAVDPGEKMEGEDGQCRISMTLANSSIKVVTDDCGMMVDVDGVYKKGINQKSILPEKTGLMTDEEEQKFKTLVGSDYQQFLKTSCTTYEPELDLDDLKAIVHLGTSQDGSCLVMITPEGKFMAGLHYFGDPSVPEVVRYYSNNSSFARTLPKTIDAWRKRGKELPVVMAVVPEQTSGPTTASVPKPALTPAPESSLKIKGLFIGMDITTVLAILKQKFPAGQDFEIADLVAERQSVMVLHGTDGVVAIIARGPDSPAVAAIAFEKVAVDALFNAAGMEASEFAKAFVDAYQIPSMDVSDDRKSWVYLSPEGYKVNITLGKQLIIVKTPNSTERKKSFD